MYVFITVLVANCHVLASACSEDRSLCHGYKLTPPILTFYLLLLAIGFDFLLPLVKGKVIK